MITLSQPNYLPIELLNIFIIGLFIVLLGSGVCRLTIVFIWKSGKTKKRQPETFHNHHSHSL